MLGPGRPKTPPEAKAHRQVKAKRETSDDCTPTHDRPRRRLRDPIRRQRSQPRQDKNQPIRRPRPGRPIQRQRRRLGVPRPTKQKQESPAAGTTPRRPLRAHASPRPARDLRQARPGRPAPATGHAPSHRKLARNPAANTRPGAARPGAARFSERVDKPPETSPTKQPIHPRPRPRHPL